MRWKHFATALAFFALAMPAWAQSPIATLGGSCTTGYSTDQITAIENNIVVCNGTTWQNLLSAPAADPNYSIAIGSGVLANDLANGGNNGLNNVGVGNAALANNTTGYRNVAIGSTSLSSNTTGLYSTAVGYFALNSAGNGTYTVGDTAVGYYAAGHATGIQNTAVGASALGTYGNTGSYNLALGSSVASTTLTTGSYNILIGVSSAVDTPASNTSNFLDIGNTIFATGTNTGTVSAPAGNVGIGTASPTVPLDVAGSIRSTTSNVPASGVGLELFYYTSSSQGKVLAYDRTGNGYKTLDLNDSVYITGGSNSNTTIGTTTPAGTGLTVAGAVYASAFQPSSDRRLKKNIATLTDSLAKISLLRGVSYDWRTPAERDIAKDMYFDTEHHQMGVVAEEVEQVYPDIVHTAPNGLKSVNYDALMGPMIEAIKTLDGRTDKLTIAVVILYAAAGFQFLRGRRSRAA